MAQSLYSTPWPHRHFVPTRWAYPKEPLKMRSENQAIDYSETVTMQSGGGGYWRDCNSKDCEKTLKPESNEGSVKDENQ